jgi:phosphocarrier protein
MMKNFSYTIKDEIGIHARPAGLLAKKAKEFQSVVTLEKDGKTAAATKLMAIMGMGVKCGDTVNVTVEGSDEETAAAAMEEFFKANL